jgi:hypothetical protein
LLPLPSVTDDAAWSTPAAPGDVAEAAAHFVAACEPAAGPDRIAGVARLLSTRSYTTAELLAAMRDLPFDPEASHNYGRGLNLADVERIVARYRQRRARLRQSITAATRDDLLAECSDLDPEDFHCCGFDERNAELYRYAPNVRLKGPRPAPTPMLDEPKAVTTDDRVRGVVKIMPLDEPKGRTR